MFVQHLNIAAILAASFGIACAQLDKPLVVPAMPALDAGLLKHLAAPAYTTSQWEWGWIPQWCKDEAVSEKLSPYDIEVFNIHYNDCKDVWIFCRHNAAQASQKDMIDIFGRMPVRTRQFVRHILAVPGTISAGSSGDNIALRGTGPNLISVLIHEAAHSMDSHAVDSLSKPFHNTAEWLAAYKADSAISDDYAQTSQSENFAQTVVIAVFDKVVPGGIGSVQPSWAAIKNQYTTAQKWLGDLIIPGGTCTARLENSPVASMGRASGNGARMRRRARGGKPDVSLSKDTKVIPAIAGKKIHITSFAQ
ncbi:hypothetical protein DFH27DRAFT_283202 [Peziza echinospora]|nr:hypothetical protein DFH27DRAFT_283202 [Peziza echinospora]